jgi:NitT/TauT family transport system ATP-binding protein
MVRHRAPIDIAPLPPASAPIAHAAAVDILLSAAARNFAELDTQTCKQIFAHHLLASVPLAQHIKRVIDERPGHRAPRVRFEQELEDYLSDAATEETLDAVIDSARYAGDLRL